MHPHVVFDLAFVCCMCCRITLELRDRQTKVDVLHAKFETLASRVHGTDADGGEPKSQAYYIVKVGVLQGWRPAGALPLLASTCACRR